MGTNFSYQKVFNWAKKYHNKSIWYLIQTQQSFSRELDSLEMRKTIWNMRKFHFQNHHSTDLNFTSQVVDSVHCACEKTLIDFRFHRLSPMWLSQSRNSSANDFMSDEWNDEFFSTFLSSTSTRVLHVFIIQWSDWRVPSIISSIHCDSSRCRCVNSFQTLQVHTSRSLPRGWKSFFFTFHFSHGNYRLASAVDVGRRKRRLSVEHNFAHTWSTSTRKRFT